MSVKSKPSTRSHASGSKISETDTSAMSAGYGAVNIAYDKTFECSEEFTHGVDCLSARDPAHFAELVNEFASDEALRLRLAKGSRAVYERHFTMEALYPEYERILAVATTPDSKVMPCAS